MPKIETINGTYLVLALFAVPNVGKERPIKVIVGLVRFPDCIKLL
jgi:hypothetical protein